MLGAGVTGTVSQIVLTASLVDFITVFIWEVTRGNCTRSHIAFRCAVSYGAYNGTSAAIPFVVAYLRLFTICRITVAIGIVSIETVSSHTIDTITWPTTWNPTSSTISDSFQICLATIFIYTVAVVPKSFASVNAADPFLAFCCGIVTLAGATCPSANRVGTALAIRAILRSAYAVDTTVTHYTISVVSASTDIFAMACLGVAGLSDIEATVRAYTSASVVSAALACAVRAAYLLACSIWIAQIGIRFTVTAQAIAAA